MSTQTSAERSGPRGSTVEPWTNQDGPDQTSTVFAGPDRHIVCECITEIWSAHQRIACARLISAAPTMLEALREIRDSADTGPLNRLIAERAIAKAEGRA